MNVWFPYELEEVLRLTIILLWRLQVFNLNERRHRILSVLLSRAPRETESCPLCFSLLLKDLPIAVEGPLKQVKFILYADDAVAYGMSKSHVQQAIARLNEASAELGLSLNLDETKAMKFRNGGILAKSDELKLLLNLLSPKNTNTKVLRNHILRRFGSLPATKRGTVPPIREFWTDHWTHVFMDHRNGARGGGTR